MTKITIQPNKKKKETFKCSCVGPKFHDKKLQMHERCTHTIHQTKHSTISMASSESPKHPCPSTVSVANFVSLRLSLNKDNLERSIKDYRIWKEQMVCLLKSQELLDFINDQIPPHEESMEDQKLWRRTDALIKGWILGSITGIDVLDAVVGLETSREVWLELENIFKSDKNGHIQKEEDGETMHNQSESSANAVDQGNTPAGIPHCN